MTDAKKAQILTNIELAIQVIEASPENEIDLEAFKTEGIGCGTIHCAAGLLTTCPYFANLGMALRLNGCGSFRLYNLHSPAVHWQFEFISEIFGKDGFNVLFSEYGSGSFDLQVMNSLGFFDHMDCVDFSEINWGEVGVKPITDKQLALARMAFQADQVAKAE